MDCLFIIALGWTEDALIMNKQLRSLLIRNNTQKSYMKNVFNY